MNDEMVVHENVQLGVLQAHSPGDVIRRATEIANPLADLIHEKELYRIINKKKYVFVEGWTTLGAMLGIFPRTVRVDEILDGVFEAEVELIRGSDGMTVGGGIAECGADPPWDNRQRYAKKSMAITRASGKAYRLSLAWIMKLAGYEGTPAEEMADAINGEFKEVKEEPAKTDPKPKGKSWGKDSFHRAKQLLMDNMVLEPDSVNEHVMALLQLSPFDENFEDEALVRWGKLYRGERDADGNEKMKPKEAAKIATEKFKEG